ncbi:hypothetical protein EDD85DRAFT_764080 [Armillaria nabsnona]|nr:hypothetical protein EDD85DRAFT_764080 [Armillaria nabsnona]
MVTVVHNIHATLVEAYRFCSTTMDDPPRKELSSGSALSSTRSFQPCNSTLRDTWIQADQNQYDGANACTQLLLSWGLGMNTANYVDDASIPSGCRIPSLHIVYYTLPRLQYSRKTK